MILKSRKTGIVVVAIMILLSSRCKQYYEPDVIKSNKNYLVVDGFLNAGGDTTIITLSHTASLYDTAVRFPEKGAQVIVEGENADAFPLAEQSKGVYSIDHLTLNNGEQYRINITLADGRHYVSDFISVKITPAIDSLTWRRDSIGLSVYLNTHDPQNNTRYYRWKYEETWSYTSNDMSLFDWVDSQLVIRQPADQVYYCWGSAVSKNLLLGSSAKLGQDVIYNTRMASVERGSEKVGDLYSIFVKQYALTKEAFEYIQNLKKNTEETGSVFDGQPTELTSNIHSVSDPHEPVMGFITACTVETKRLFINNHGYQLPDWRYRAYYLTYDCKRRVFTTSQMDSIFSGPGKYEWVVMGTPPRSPPGFYIVASSNCTDCTNHGGTNIKPSFWP